MKETFQELTEGIVIGTVVDVSTRNTKYRAIDLATRDIIFERAFIGHTNNCAGFLAIVHALSHLRQQKSAAPVYCTNSVAIEWVMAGNVKSHVSPTKIRENYLNRVRLATEWLRLHKYENKLVYWPSDVFGENPATYNPIKRGYLNGRKRDPEERLAGLIADSKKRNI